MKKLLLAALMLIGTGILAQAKDGYNIQLQFGNKPNTKAYLAHYFGKPLPTIYKVDSVQLDANGKGTLKSSSEIFGGIYIVVLDDNATYFEFLLKNGDEFAVKVETSKLPQGVTFKKSPENDRFLSYVSYLAKIGAEQQQLKTEYANAKTSADSNLIVQKSSKLNKDLVAYRKDYVSKYPNTLLANILGALLLPEVPDGKHLLADGTEDKDFTYLYFKNHYWDGFDFSDNRLVYTPVYDNKLEYYFKELVLQLPDSFNKDADEILAKARAGKEVFKYTLHWLSQYTQDSKVMGMDASFVHLVENYYMKGDAFWLNPGTLQKYVDRAQSIAPNVIGNVAPDLKMQDINGKVHALSGINAKYTVLVFWSPDCGHCQEEIPRVDSVYNAILKKKGVKIYAVNVDRDDTARWTSVIAKSGGLKDWVHVYDPERKSNYKAQYDVYGTPRIYLLDEKKIIRGKMLDYKSINTVIELLEEEQKTASKK